MGGIHYSHMQRCHFICGADEHTSFLQLHKDRSRISETRDSRCRDRLCDESHAEFL